MVTGPDRRSSRLRWMLACAGAGLLLLTACSDPIEAINMKSTTKATADNGDDGDWPPDTKTYPARSAHDGGTLAVSHPIDFNQFFVVADAKVGAKAKRMARANALGETTSNFRINRLWGSRTVDFSVRGVMTVNITSGTSAVYYVLALTDVVTGTAVTPAQRFSYFFSPNPADSSKIDVKFQGNLVKTIPNGGGRFDDVQVVTVKIKNGDYKFDLSWDTISSADGTAEMTASVAITAK